MHQVPTCACILGGIPQVRSALRTHLAALQPVEVVLPRGRNACGLVGGLGCGLDPTTSRVLQTALRDPRPNLGRAPWDADRLLQVCVFGYVGVWLCVGVCGCVGVRWLWVWVWVWVGVGVGVGVCERVCRCGFWRGCGCVGVGLGVKGWLWVWGCIARARMRMSFCLSLFCLSLGPRAVGCGPPAAGACALAKQENPCACVCPVTCVHAPGLHVVG